MKSPSVLTNVEMSRVTVLDFPVCGELNANISVPTVQYLSYNNQIGILRAHVYSCIVSS